MSENVVAGIVLLAVCGLLSALAGLGVVAAGRRK
jgi:hypothetical protein